MKLDEARPGRGTEGPGRGESTPSRGERGRKARRANPADPADPADRADPAITPRNDHATTLRPPVPKRPPVDRGARPLMRGRLHECAAWVFTGSGTALIAVAAARNGAGLLTWLTALYVACLVGSMGVSALYHLGKWRSDATVQWWRRADHAMIAVFIAGTYGPVCAASLPQHTAAWVLALCWLGALAAVVLNMVWIGHPRWLDAAVYLALGWLVVWFVPELWTGAGPAITILIAIGGVVYSLGAIVYALKWPNPSERWFGFHEVFHSATIIAAILHHVAIWLLVAAL